MPAFMLPMCRSVEIESGRKPSLTAGTAIAPGEAAAAVADVEDHAALAPLQQRRVHVARRRPARRAGRSRRGCRCRRAAASSSPARPAGRSGWFAPKSTITGMFAERAGLDRALDRRPLGPGVVRGLDADDQALVLAAPSRRSASASMSARSCSNVPPRMPWPTMLRNASTRVRERSMTRVLEVLEVAPAGAAGVDHGRHADAEA